ncbi:hypothetical protein JCM5353_001126 [Sporobolomyces roseus]
MSSRSSLLNRSTSSTSSNKSVEKSAGDMGTAENAIGGGHSSSIPQLPDEIILHIFEIIREDAKEFDRFADIATGANSYLRVNRHFYSLLRSSWFSTLFDTCSKTSARFARVLKQPLILTWIREVSVTFESDSPPYEEFANLSRLVNLHKLTARFEYDEYEHRNSHTVDVELMLQPLANLPKLVHLDFASNLKTTFASLSLARIAPALELLRISVEESKGLANLFRTLPGSLQRLDMDNGPPLSALEWRAIPWGALKEFSMSTSKGKRGLFNALESALYSVTPRTELVTARRIPLESLTLNFEVSTKSEEYFDLRDLHDLIGLLGPTQLRCLQIILAGDDNPEWGVPISVPSLEKLTLYGLFSLHDKANFRLLWRIICTFPSLRVLHLHWFYDDEEASPITNAIAGHSRGGLGLIYPELSGILLFLEEDTQVLEVVYQEYEAQSWTKWQRSHPPDQFQKELYRYNFE